MQNFGKIKNTFNELMVESIVTNKETNKNLFKNYVKAIKENEVLKTQFLVYDNIENKIEENELKANLFIQENIALLDKFSKKDIMEANSKLIKPVKSKQGDYSNEKDALYENITKLIFTNKNTKTIDTIVESMSFIIDYIKNNKTKTVNKSFDLPNSMLSKIMVDKYNEKYASLSETEKKILKVLINSDDVKKKEVYSNVIRECLDMINEKLNGSDLDTKDKLLRVKDKLLNDKVEIDEDFSKNISKLLELKNSLE
jgi:hypothetical protein